MLIRTYHELSGLETWDERFAYLRLGGSVGRSTFGFDRYINQRFYTSREWKDIRNHIIVRDNGCDLGVEGYEIAHRPIIHHINPMEISDIIDPKGWILDPNFLITVTHDTHNAIHYGNDYPGPKIVIERSPGDTTLWRR